MSTNRIKKTSGHSIRRFFLWFEKVDKHRTGDAKGDKKGKKEDTKQFEPDGKWNKKNMCSKNKNKRKEKNTQRRHSEKRKKGDEQMKKYAKKKTKKP